jgi:sulfite exporter TauE/SafE
MIAHLQTLAAWCGTLPGGPALLLAMFVAGLGGSAVHCVPMCGPFVLGQVADRLARAPAAGLCEMTRVRGALLLPYHIGRLLTYAGLGAAAATLGGVADRVRYLPAALLVAAGAMCALYALRRLLPRAFPSKPAPASGGTRLLVRMARLVDRSRPSGGFLLGVLLGFLPCGMLYAALVLAAATQSPVAGAAAMLAFGLGTVPALVMVGIAGHAAHRLRGPWRRGGLAAMTAPAIMLANAGLLWVLAGRLLAG